MSNVIHNKALALLAKNKELHELIKAQDELIKVMADNARLQSEIIKKQEILIKLEREEHVSK